MSIGPSEKIKTEEVPTFSRFSASAKKIVTQYFEKPSHYLFYLMLTFGSLALLIQRDPSFKFWIVLAVVGLLDLGKTKTEIIESKILKEKPNLHGKRK